MADKMSSVKTALLMNTENLKVGVQKASVELEKLGKTAKKTSKAVQTLANIEKLKLGFAAVSGAFRGITGSIRSVSNGITSFVMENTELLKNQIAVAKQLGLSQEQYATLGNVAAEAGIKVEQLNEPLFKIATSISAARKGSGAAAEAFRTLGINANKIAQLSPWERLGRISDAIKGIKDVNKQSLVLNQIFGETGQRLREFLKFGSDGFEKLRQATIATGQAINEIGVAQIERLDAAVRDLQDNFQGLKNQILVTIEPYVTALLKAVTKRLQDPNFRKRIMAFFEVVAETAGTFVVGIIESLRKTMNQMVILVDQLVGVTKLLQETNAFYNPFYVNPRGRRNLKADFDPPEQPNQFIGGGDFIKEWKELVGQLKADMAALFKPAKVDPNVNANQQGAVDKVVDQVVEKFKDVFTVVNNQANANSKPGQLSGAEVGTAEGNRLLLKALDDGYNQPVEVTLMKKQVKILEKIERNQGNDIVANLQGAQ